MAKSDPVQETLAKLSTLQSLGPSALAAELAKYLSSKQNLVVAKAAEMAARAGAKGLESQLVEAFGRFMIRGPSTDKGCIAKKALADSLYKLDCGSDGAREVFLAGIRHVQMEPVWGGSEDTAAELRGICGLGLVRCGYRGVTDLLVDLLADASPQTRMMGARAIAYSGRDEGASLLRLKILVGDRDEQVTAECLSALAELSGVKALEFFRRLLDDPRHAALVDVIAMAIGQTRHADSLAVLRVMWDSDPRSENRKMLLQPIALSRLPQAIDFLIELIRSQPEELAEVALDALRMYRHDPSIRAKISAVVTERESLMISQSFRKYFGE